MHDDLNGRLTAAAEDVSLTIRIPPPTQIRVRGDRRRAGVAAATSAIAVGTVAALGTVGVSTLPSGRSLGPGSAAPTTEIPNALSMPHQGEPGWRRDDNATIEAVFDGCGTSDPTLVGRTDARTMTGPGRPGEEAHSPTRVTEQLFLYDGEPAAKAAIAALATGVTTCGWIDPGMGQQLSGTHFLRPLPTGEYERIAGIQVGNAMYLVYTRTSGAGMSSAGIDDPSIMSDRLCTVMRLCLPSAPGVSGSPQPGGSPGSPSPGGSPGFPSPGGSPGHPSPGGYPGSPSPGFPSPGGSPGLGTVYASPPR